MGLLVEARLGRGRLLETFAARLDERAVVIKRPRPELVRAPGFGAALAAWGESQQELTHPNLVAVLGVEQTIDGPVVVQQRIDGATLGAVEKALTRRKRGFQPAMALMIIRDVGRALQYLQQQGRCHGGLDPQDVLLGYDGRAWLSDPGLSALEEQTAGAIEPSSGLSPYQGEPEASFAGDIYAAGLLLLEMLLGQPLWTKEKMNVTAAPGRLQGLHEHRPGSAPADRTAAPALGRVPQAGAE
jgi:serine/threonine protein kinase